MDLQVFFFSLNNFKEFGYLAKMKFCLVVGRLFKLTRPLMKLLFAVVLAGS